MVEYVWLMCSLHFTVTGNLQVFWLVSHWSEQFMWGVWFFSSARVYLSSTPWQAGHTVNIFIVNFLVGTIGLIENDGKIRSRPTVGDVMLEKLNDDACGWPHFKHTPTKWLLEIRQCWPTSVLTKVETSGGGTSKSPLNAENPRAAAHGC